MTCEDYDEIEPIRQTTALIEGIDEELTNLRHEIQSMRKTLKALESVESTLKYIRGKLMSQGKSDE